jgi:predicted ATPase/DNA-binding winged helix-turn-helix (wHTH) protein
MGVTAASAMNLRFGRFVLLPGERALLQDGQRVALGGRALDVLTVLATRAGRLVSKSQLLDEAWPGLVVEESNIAAQIMALRKTLGADTIATVAGHGYRFTSEVAQFDAPLPAAVAKPAPPVAPAVNALPLASTSFVGRAQELAHIEALLPAHRVVSLLGPGGIGKTRLAAAAAEHAQGRFVDGVWWLELAPLQDAALVTAEMASLWGLRSGDGSTVEQVLLRHLAPRQLLLVVDNCEHLRGAVAALLGKLLRAAPGVHVLATSRESLGVRGEVELRVAPLGLDSTDGRPGAGDAMRLFLDRMQAVRPGAALGAGDLDAVQRVCRRLEGVPLGLELAAVRLRVLTPAELADRLDHSFGVLGAARKTAPAHQSSLDAALDWSHDLLAPDEQALLRRLAVFAGGFDLEAAEAVCGTRTAGAGTVVALLDALVDKSLVLPQAGGNGRARFHLLEPTRQYALQRLQDAGEAGTLALAHAHHFAAVVAAVAPGLQGGGQVAARQRIERDLGNVRVALRTLLVRRAHAPCLRLSFDLFLFWWHAAMHVEGLAALLDGLRQAGDEAPAPVRARAWFAAAHLAAQLSDPRSIDHARAGLAVALSGGSPSDAARLRLMLAAAIHLTGDDFETFRRELDEGELALAADSGEPWWTPGWDAAFLHLLVLGTEWGAHPAYAQHRRAALERFERAGDGVMTALTLAYGAMQAGPIDRDELVANLQRSATLLATHRSPHTEGHLELVLGRVLADGGDADAGGRYLASAMRKLRDLGDMNCWSGACRGLAAVQLGRGDTAEACEHVAAALQALPQVLWPSVAAANALDLAADALLAQGRLDEAAFTLGVDVGRIDFSSPERAARPARDPGSRPRQARVREQLQQRLGAEPVQRQLDAAAALPADVALQRVAGWLRA